MYADHYLPEAVADHRKIRNTEKNMILSTIALNILVIGSAC